MSEYFTSHDDILENKLGITDPQVLKQIEEEIVPVRTAEIYSSFPVKAFDFDMLRKIHFIMFSDLYQMAGQVRNVDMVRGDNRIPFCFTQNIDQEQRRIFGILNQENDFVGLDREAFVKKIAWLSSELNALHPFRDGNGRAIRAFLVLLAAHAGFELDYSKVDKDELIEADVRAFLGDVSSLEEVYSQSILIQKQ